MPNANENVLLVPGTNRTTLLKIATCKRYRRNYCTLQLPLLRSRITGGKSIAYVEIAKSATEQRKRFPFTVCPLKSGHCPCIVYVPVHITRFIPGIRAPRFIRRPFRRCPQKTKFVSKNTNNFIVFWQVRTRFSPISFQCSQGIKPICHRARNRNLRFHPAQYR